ncbi:hypothetical protein BDF22DRAFT_742935 [Syncephalis plumigaleata]|nr:hypothetical protein BDF22DRAFT_742935 [Syncephalis plumigaleata]
MANADIHSATSSTTVATLYEPSSGASILFKCTLSTPLFFNVHAEDKLVGRCVMGEGRVSLTPGPNALAGELHFCPQSNDAKAILAGRHMFEAYINNTDYDIVLDITTQNTTSTTNNGNMEEADLELLTRHLGGTCLQTRVPHLNHSILQDPRYSVSLFSILGSGKAKTQTVISNPICVDIKANRFCANLFTNPDDDLLGCIEADYGKECIVFPANADTLTPIFPWR